MSDQELYEKIEAYLNGELEGKVLSEFEVRIQSDKELSAKVELFKDIDFVIKDKPTLNFQKLVAEHGEAFLGSTDQKKTIVRKINWKRHLIVAATLLLFAASIFIIKNQINPDLSDIELYAKSFEPYNFNESLRGSNIDTDLFDLGIQKYEEGSFEEASVIFRQLSNAAPSDAIVTFCLANAYLNQNPPDFVKAGSEYQKIIRDGKSIYVSASKWYLALISLAQGNRSEAEKLLNELKNEGGTWGVKANKLIKKL